MTIALILVEIFTVIMQRNVCEKAFDRKPAGTAVQVMVWAAFYIISNVTTGKIDVREVYIPEYDASIDEDSGEDDSILDADETEEQED